MKNYIDLFQQHGGSEMFIKAKNYEEEIDVIEKHN